MEMEEVEKEMEIEKVEEVKMEMEEVEEDIEEVEEEEKVEEVEGKTGTVQYKELGVLGGSAANWGCFAGPLDSRLERHFGTCPLPLKTQ